jgi:hypothetical protein
VRFGDGSPHRCNDVCREVPQFEISSAGRGTEHCEGLVLGAPVLAHDDSQCLVNHRPRFQGRPQIVSCVRKPVKPNREAEGGLSPPGKVLDAPQNGAIKVSGPR